MEHMICMNATSMRALLDGIKTQTRRPVKPKHGRAPFGVAGDQLSVFEDILELGTWADEAQTVWQSADRIHYIADGAVPDVPAGMVWRHCPAKAMRRKHSRLTLLVESIRRERISQISKVDAIAEGLRRLPASGRWVIEPGDQYFGLADHDPREVFALWWDLIYGAGEFEHDGEVWVITFSIKRKV